MDAEIYIDNNSFIHRLDPRVKIIIFLLTFVAILLFQDPLWMLPITVLIIIQLVVSGALVNMRRIRYILIVLTISSLILWNLFSSGETKLFWFFSVESLTYAVARTMLMILMISTGMVLITSTRNEELVNGMIRLGMPYRVGFAISTALRLVPTIVTSGRLSADLPDRNSNSAARCSSCALSPASLPTCVAFSAAAEKSRCCRRSSASRNNATACLTDG